MSQCQGRRTLKTEQLFFDAGPRLHRGKPLLFLAPRRCVQAAEDLCLDCLDRLAATEKAVAKVEGKYVPNQDSLFHGRVSEPVPPWSRLYNGIWWNAQVTAGYTMSSETVGKLEQYKGLVGITDMPKATAVPMPKATAVPMPKATLPVEAPDVKEDTPAKPKAKKKVVAATAEAVAPEPVPVPVAKPKAKKKAVAVAVAVAAPDAPVPVKPKRTPVKKEVPKPVGIISPDPIVDTTIITIKVKKIEVDGRAVLLDSVKGKVYDMKFNYLGRYNGRDDRIESQYPDSDREF